MLKLGSHNLITRRATLGGLLSATACAPRSPSRLNLEDGQTLRVVLPNGGHAFLSRFNISKTAIDHIAREALLPITRMGDYFPNSKSPEFERMDCNAVLAAYQSQYREKAQAFINCSFFERYDPATELSFPIKQAGRVITGGSSPYGPRANPGDVRYKTVQLKALVWNEQSIKVVDYDHSTGRGLNDPNFPDGLVTYEYKDHPANVLAGDPIGRYQLLATCATRDGGSPDVLLVLTIVKGRMVEGADVLVNNGASGTILTVDGGPSTHLWTAQNGVLIDTESKDLPHYLGFRARA